MKVEKEKVMKVEFLFTSQRKKKKKKGGKKGKL